MALAGLQWCASGDVMVSGTKLVKDEGTMPHLSQIDTIGLPFAYQLPKTKEKRTSRDITAPDLTN